MVPSIFTRTDIRRGELAAALGIDPQQVTATLARADLPRGGGAHARLDFAQAACLALARHMVDAGGLSVFAAGVVARAAAPHLAEFAALLAAARAPTDVDRLAAVERDDPLLVVTYRARSLGPEHEVFAQASLLPRRRLHQHAPLFGGGVTVTVPVADLLRPLLEGLRPEAEDSADA